MGKGEGEEETGRRRRWMGRATSEAKGCRAARARARRLRGAAGFFVGCLRKQCGKKEGRGRKALLEEGKALSLSGPLGLGGAGASGKNSGDSVTDGRQWRE